MSDWVKKMKIDQRKLACVLSTAHSRRVAARPRAPEYLQSYPGRVPAYADIWPGAGAVFEQGRADRNRLVFWWPYQPSTASTSSAGNV